MTLISQMQEDTVLIISDWNVSMKIGTPSISTAIPPVRTWSLGTAFIGDHQPYKQQNFGGVREFGIDEHYDFRIFTPYDLTVEIGDRVVKTSDDSFSYIKKILRYEDHIEILTTINESS